jgi:hypothetical protein
MTKTCIRGHAIAGDNLYIIPSTGKRRCKACRLHLDREKIGAPRLAGTLRTVGRPPGIHTPWDR